MSASHSWQGHVEKSNKRERARVAKKYSGGNLDAFDSDADPFIEGDPILDLAPETKHDAKEYARASALPLAKAKKILKDTGTLRK